MEPNRRKADISPEQSQLINEAARCAVRGYRNRAIAGFTILLLAVGYLFNEQERESVQRAQDAKNNRAALARSGNIVAADGCNRDFRDRQAIRGVMIASRANQKRAYKRGEISREQYIDGREFFRDQLQKLALPDCRKALSVLTDDPSKELDFPQPLYPQEK